MKNISRIFIGFALIISGSSCNEKIYDETVEGVKSIIVKSEVLGQVKAGYEGTKVLPGEFVMDINQGSDEIFDYTLVKMIKEDEENIYKAEEDKVLVWAGTDHSKTFVKAMTMPYGISAIDGENPMEIKVNLDQTTDENIKESDLLGAESEDGIKIEGNDINISFSHLLTKLHIDYKLSERLKDKSAEIKSITLNNICVSGGYSYAEMDYDSNVKKKYGDIKMYLDTDYR